MAAKHRSGGPEGGVGGRRDLAVAERPEAAGHSGSDGEQPAHRRGITGLVGERVAEEHEPAALRVDDTRKCTDRGDHRGVRRQDSAVLLRVAAAKVDPVHRRERCVSQRREVHQLGTGLTEQVEVVLVVEVERGVARYADPDMRRPSRRGRRHSIGDSGERKERVKIERLAPRCYVRDPAGSSHELRRDQPEVPFGDRDLWPSDQRA